MDSLAFRVRKIAGDRADDYEVVVNPPLVLPNKNGEVTHSLSGCVHTAQDTTTITTATLVYLCGPERKRFVTHISPRDEFTGKLGITMQELHGFAVCTLLGYALRRVTPVHMCIGKHPAWTCIKVMREDTRVVHRLAGCNETKIDEYTAECVRVLDLPAIT